MQDISSLTPTLLQELQQILGDRLVTSAAVRDHHSHDESYHPARLPDAVAFPTITTAPCD